MLDEARARTSAPQLRFVRADRQLTLPPRRGVLATVLCPRSHFMLTWGLEPRGARPPGALPAIPFGVFPRVRQGRGGFTFRLVNVNSQAPVTTLLSISCVGGRRIVTRVHPSAGVARRAGGVSAGVARPAGGASAGPARQARTPLPVLTLRGVRRTVTLRPSTTAAAARGPAARAAAEGNARIDCPRGQIFTEMGFDSMRSELRRREFGAGTGGRAPGVRLFFSTPATSDTVRVFATCLRADRLRMLGLLDRQRAPSISGPAIVARYDTVPATASLIDGVAFYRARAGGLPGVVSATPASVPPGFGIVGRQGLAGGLSCRGIGVVGGSDQSPPPTLPIARARWETPGIIDTQAFATCP